MHDLLVLAFGALLGAGGILLRSYLSEKGRNIATKEDIATITREVEGVKAESVARCGTAGWRKGIRGRSSVAPAPHR